MRFEAIPSGSFQLREPDMRDRSNWSPTPIGWQTMPASTPRARGEEVWRLTQGERVATCELRDDSAVGAGWEVVIRRNDEIIAARRYLGESQARHGAETFKQGFARNGWTDQPA